MEVEISEQTQKFLNANNFRLSLVGRLRLFGDPHPISLLSLKELNEFLPGDNHMSDSGAMWDQIREGCGCQ